LAGRCRLRRCVPGEFAGVPGRHRGYVGCAPGARRGVAGSGRFRRRLVIVIQVDQVVELEEARGVALERLRQDPGGAEQRRAPFLEIAEKLARQVALAQNQGLLHDSVQSGDFFTLELGFERPELGDCGRDEGAQTQAALVRRRE
jgi:hypothetical protein